MVNQHVFFPALVLKNELQKVIHYRKMSKKRNAGIQHPTFLKDLKVRQNYLGDFHAFVHINSTRRPCKHSTALISFIESNLNLFHKLYVRQCCLLSTAAGAHYANEQGSFYTCVLSNCSLWSEHSGTTAPRQRQRQRQLQWYLQTSTDKRIPKYEKRFGSVFSGAHTDLSKCSNEAGCRLQELILKMKQNTGKRFTLGYISSTCVRWFNGFGMKTG